MSHNDHWIPNNHPNFTRRDRQQRPQEPHATNFQGQRPSDAIQNGQRLLAVYPPASATPTHHVSRHISSMTLTAAPTFPQPNYYNVPAGGSDYSQRNPAPFSDYDHQLRYMSSQQQPVDDSGYWENTRNDAVRADLCKPLELLCQ
ncbi:hypothetical protein BDN70DRAFT_927257 [Pholiota conissans]|uniref:Uncharacterized protein n=1 Tax=Pholiota conissans TaxID=109636 RepID=A0A9P5ZF15_9AGAR|nr:hypothetical protein BDN70DRAFT_927257 [Pholiota conissans]